MIGFIAGIISGIAGAVGSAASSGISAAANAAEAKKQREFQERMYKNRHQYQVEDLEKAGLNKALSYMQSPGASPSGAKASIDLSGAGKAVSQGISTAMEVRDRQAAIRNMEKDTKLKEAMINVAGTNAANNMQNMMLTQAKTDTERSNAAAAAFNASIMKNTERVSSWETDQMFNPSNRALRDASLWTKPLRDMFGK
jgi:hypothetical protein